MKAKIVRVKYFHSFKDFGEGKSELVLKLYVEEAKNITIRPYRNDAVDRGVECFIGFDVDTFNAEVLAEVEVDDKMIDLALKFVEYKEALELQQTNIEFIIEQVLAKH